MRALLIYASALVSMLAVFVLGEKMLVPRLCWCWPPAHGAVHPQARAASREFVPSGSYGMEVDWGNPDHKIPLDYRQDQGKRLFYHYCVWCHAESTPAGPSNRSNLSPEPPLLNDAAFLNRKSDAALEQVIELGGSPLGKSALMPPYGSTLSRNEIRELIEFMRKLESSTTVQTSLTTQASAGGNPQ